MKYKIVCRKSEEEINISMCTIICQDSEAKAFLRAINRELKRMRAERKREMAKGLKEGIRAIPHRLLHKKGDEFSFDNFHFEDICIAAESLGKQRIKVRSSFLSPLLEINPELVNAFKKAIIDSHA